MSKIFMYWEDVPGWTQHAYIDLCKEIIYKHCQNDFEMVFVTPDNLSQYLPGEHYSSITCVGAPEPSDHISVKVDYIRTALLHKYGGIWIDVDTILLHDLNFLWGLANEHGFVAVECTSTAKRIVANTIMAASQDSVVMEKYIARLEDIVSSRKSLFLGETSLILTQVLQESEEKYLLPEHSFFPITWEQWELFFSEGAEIEDYAKDDTYGFALSNNLFPVSFKELTREEVLESPVLIGKLFRKAFTITT